MTTNLLKHLREDLLIGIKLHKKTKYRKQNKIIFFYFRCWSVLTPYDPFYLGNIFWMVSRHALTLADE